MLCTTVVAIERTIGVPMALRLLGRGNKIALPREVRRDGSLSFGIVRCLVHNHANTTDLIVLLCLCNERP